MSNRYLVLVLTEPTDGNEDRFNDYYENTHLDEVIASTGWLSAQRFKLIDEVGEPCPLPYLAAYEAEADTAGAVLNRLNETRPERQQSDSLNKRTGRVWVFEQIGPKHDA
ncbi:MAG: hypothetical protein CMP89_08595 [Gammaproteobacteria bacterium]|jgi:hypothetical protein|nr:hypothetical protein [Gammaproteobacteria bacterium]HCC43192.1 hypothetical protein [Gammaproteobacteria bacterium]|tara:strand:- start:443 stop:772 length:330 start_codon:yes stop_codon:yes gene_type:complete